MLFFQATNMNALLYKKSLYFESKDLINILL